MERRGYQNQNIGGRGSGNKRGRGRGSWNRRQREHNNEDLNDESHRKQCVMTLRVDKEAFPEARSKVESEQNNLKEELTARLIGKGGQNVKKMKRDTNTEIIYRGDHVIIRGTEEGIDKAAELICEEIKKFVEKKKDVIAHIEKSMKGPVMGKSGQNLGELGEVDNSYVYRSRGEVHARAPNEEKAEQTRQSVLTKAVNGRVIMSSVPEDCLGAIFGKHGSTIRTIQSETSTKVIVDTNDLKIEIFGATENQKKARLRIRNIIVSVLQQRKEAFTYPMLYIDKSRVNENAEFTLEQLDSSESCLYQLKLVEEESCNKGNTAAETFHAPLKNELLKILRQLHCEKDEKGLELDMWCHFGRVYFRGIDEETVQQGEYFSMDDIENRIKPSSNSTVPQWKAKYRNGITKMELEELEKTLQGVGENVEKTLQGDGEDHRRDLTFYTPTYRQVRVKVWLKKKEQDLAAAADAGCYSFAPTPPVHVRNQLQVVSSGESDSSPSFFLCAPHERRFTADIILPGYRFDCRLILRTTETDATANQKPHEKEEDQIIKDCLSEMQINQIDGSLKFPEIDDFDVSYVRKSVRRTYSQSSDGVPCSLTVSKEEETITKDADADVDNDKRVCSIESCFSSMFWKCQVVSIRK